MKYRIILENESYYVERFFVFTWHRLRFFKANIGPNYSRFDTFEEAKQFVDKIRVPAKKEVIWESENEINNA